MSFFITYFVYEDAVVHGDVEPQMVRVLVSGQLAIFTKNEHIFEYNRNSHDFEHI